jgi:2-phosphosulfolactate phosphatase
MHDIMTSKEIYYEYAHKNNHYESQEERLNLHIYFTPAELSAVEAGTDDVYIVIDVIRATTSITVMFDRGATRVFAANTVEQAREGASIHAGRLLCGERHALPLPDFDYGNSPAQFAQLDLAGRELILTTTNGSRAFYACSEQSVRLAGCFYNAQAVTAQALRFAQERHSNIAIICAGELGYFALDDATCAGYLAQELQRQYPAIQVHESVLAATAIYQSYAPPRMLEVGASAQSVIAANLGEDLDVCTHIDGSKSVPMVTGKEPDTGLLSIVRI